METLKKIIEELKIVRKESLSSLSDDVLFENAVKVYISREIAKQKEVSKTDKATEKQIKFLGSLGFQGKTEDLTKIEAQKIIKELLENQGENY
ncbi:MAG TPA: hypothetical protein VGB37_15480 [Candidatus Lokiarchaeia archaeon]